MSAFLHTAALQLKLDIRSRTLLVSCYIVPLIFFLLMGGIFTSVMPEMKSSLIPSMIVMIVSMGAFIGLPPTLIETYGTDIKKIYRANGVPLCFGLAAAFISAFIHLTIMCAVIILLSPVLFEASLPAEARMFFPALAVYTAASLGIGCILGLAVKSQSKLTMIAQLIFLPSIMLSGTMFPVELLPKALEAAGRLFPGYWGFRLMLDGGLKAENLIYPAIVLAASAAVCALLLKRKSQ